MNQELLSQENLKSYKYSLANGLSIEIETGQIASQADGAIILKYGDNRVLITCCYNKKLKEGIISST